MFNKDRKEQFIEAHASSENAAYRTRNVFKATMKFELLYGKDICLFDESELRTVLKAIIPTGNTAYQPKLFVLKAYNKWCAGNGIKVCDAVLTVKPPEVNLNEVKNNSVVSPLELAVQLDKIFPPIEDASVYNRFRCWMWLAYCGIKRQDSVNVKDSDIDIGNMSISYDGDIFPIYREALPAFKAVLGASQYCVTYTNRSTLLDKAPGDILIRGTRAGEEPSVKQMTSDYARAVRAASKKDPNIKPLSYNEAWFSGMFYRQYEFEKAGLGSLLPQITEMSMTKGNDSKYAAHFKRQLKFMTRRYENWKAAHGL